MSDTQSGPVGPENVGGEVEHPLPSEATIKELYAHAFSCANPDCPEWLYKHAADAVAPVLNSRVAHIHARRPGGPRWKPGMTAEENRSARNLLLLCIAHSYEVDQQPERFPADLLQQWRLAQRAEHERLRKAWPLADEEARQVVSESFHASALNSPILTAVARAAERLATAAEDSRAPVIAKANEWTAMWKQVRASTMMWGANGERIYAEPSRMETNRYREALRNALHSAKSALEPFVQDVKAEVAAARAAVPRSSRWCEWLVRSAERVEASVSRWPGPPPAVDDDELSDAVTELRDAASAVAAALRGESPSPPPAAVAKESEVLPPAENDALARHEALLERARPFARVAHRPYDSQLRADLASAAYDAATIPPVLNALAIDLSTTAGLAARVARNAQQDELTQLIEQDRARRPMCVAVLLLHELQRVLVERGEEELAEYAGRSIIDLLSSVDWSQSETWDGNEHFGRAVFQVWASLASPTEPRQALAAALRRAPGRLVDIVICCAGWVQRENMDGSAVRYERAFRQLDAWLPRDQILAAAAEEFPAVRASTSDFDDADDEVERLIAQLLHLAAESDS